MTDLRTAAQQALEALEFANANHWWGSLTIEKAITALRAALAQQAEPVDTDCHTQGICQRSGYDIGKQAEPVGPVAWLPQSELDDLMTCNHRRLSADSPTIWAPYDISSPSPDMGLVPVYATPPQQAEPVPGTVVAWGIFALTDGEWELQHPVFVGDEQGKVNAEFERASYSGPQPLEVRPLGVVTATT